MIAGVLILIDIKKRIKEITTLFKLFYFVSKVKIKLIFSYFVILYIEYVFNFFFIIKIINLIIISFITFNIIVI